MLEFGKNIDSNKFLLPERGILVSKLNPHIIRVKEFFPPNDGRRACGSTELMVYTPVSNNTSLAFYTQYMRSEKFRRNLISAATGTTNSHKRVRPLETLHWVVPAPPLEEQEAITSILDAVDTSIERTREAIGRARELKDALTQKFLFDALGETAYANRPSKKLPHGWSLVQTEQLLETDPKNGASPKNNTQPPGIPTFSIAAIRRGMIELDTDKHLKYAQISEKAAKPYRVAFGDVLIVRGNANPDLVGKAGIIRSYPEGCIYPDITKRVVFKNNSEYSVSPEYAVLIWNHSVVHNQVLQRAKTSNGTLKINNRDVKQIVMPVAPKEEQEKIVEISQAVDKNISALKEVLGAHNQLKKALMHDLLTGRVRVNNVSNNTLSRSNL